jgi:3-oxoadipate enol-lactonase
VNRTSVDGTGIAWEDTGDRSAPAIVLCHSLGYNHEMWRPQIEALAVRYRVIAVDIRAHGASDAPPGPYDMATLATDVLAVADDAGAPEFAVCGLSLGGQIALWLGIEASDRLWSLVACNTAARIGTPQSWGARIEQVESSGMAGLVEATKVRWWSPDFAERHPDWARHGMSVLTSTDPAGYAACCSALATTDLRDAVGAITAATLVIGGSLDESTTPSDAEWLHSHVPVSELHVIDGAAHISNLDRHEEFTETLLAHLERS